MQEIGITHFLTVRQKINLSFRKKNELLNKGKKYSSYDSLMILKEKKNLRCHSEAGCGGYVYIGCGPTH